MLRDLPMEFQQGIVAASIKALRGDTTGALEALCAVVVAQGFLHAQVICSETDGARCVAACGGPPAPSWLKRELRSNRGLRSSIQRGTRFQTREYATYPLYADGSPAGVLLVGLRREEDGAQAVPAEVLALMSATLHAHARALATATELRRARAAIRRAEGAEAHLTKRLALARHDLKAPLVPVKGYLDMMLRGMGGPITPTIKRYVERSKESVDRLRDLIDFRLRNPSLPTVDLREIASEVVAAKRRPIRLHVPEDPCWVLARPDALKSALVTWIRGVRATAARGATVDLTITRGEAGWEILVTADDYATLPVRSARRCAALLAACGGQLSVGPSGVRAVLPFDPRVEVVPQNVARENPNPRPATPAEAPLGGAAGQG